LIKTPDGYIFDTPHTHHLDGFSEDDVCDGCEAERLAKFSGFGECIEHFLKEENKDED
jgi:hypothetical protein